MTTINVYDKGQVDTLLSNKADAANVYTKTQADNLLANKMDAVSTSGASEGDVLTLDANLAPVWQSGGSGGVTKHTYSTFAALRADIVNHWKEMIVVYRGEQLNTVRYPVYAQAYYVSDSIVGITMLGTNTYSTSSSSWQLKATDLTLTASDDSTKAGQVRTQTIASPSTISTTSVTFNISDFVVYY